MFSIIFGFLLRLAPELFGFVGKWLEYRQEVKLQELSLEAAKLKLEGQLAVTEMVLSEKDIENWRQTALLERQEIDKPIPQYESKFVNFYNDTAKSTLAYILIGLYAFYKFVAIDLLLNTVMPSSPPFVYADITALAWTVFDEGMIGMVIGYHFGSQTLKAIKAYRA